MRSEAAAAAAAGTPARPSGHQALDSDSGPGRREAATADMCGRGLHNVPPPLRMMLSTRVSCLIWTVERMECAGRQLDEPCHVASARMGQMTNGEMWNSSLAAGDRSGVKLRSRSGPVPSKAGSKASICLIAARGGSLGAATKSMIPRPAVALANNAEQIYYSYYRLGRHTTPHAAATDCPISLPSPHLKPNAPSRVQKHTVLQVMPFTSSPGTSDVGRADRCSTAPVDQIADDDYPQAEDKADILKDVVGLRPLASRLQSGYHLVWRVPRRNSAIRRVVAPSVKNLILGARHCILTAVAGTVTDRLHCDCQGLEKRSHVISRSAHLPCIHVCMDLQYRLRG